MSSPSRPQNILIISSIFPPHIFGGAEIAACNRARLLARRGHKVSVMTMRESDAPPAWGEKTPEGYNLYRIASPRRYTLFGRHEAYSKKEKILWHLQDYFDARNRRLAAAVLDAARPDHVQVDNPIGLGFNILPEIGRRGIPLAYILHDLHLACFKAGMFSGDRMCARHCMACRPVAALRQAPLGRVPRLGFISPSRANLDLARRHIPAIGTSLSRVIRNVPEDVPPLPPRTKAGHVRLVYAGRLDPVKGITFLIRALDRLDEKRRFHLTVLGTGPDEAELKARYGQKSWVTFRGFVPRHEVATAIAAADLLCMPSLVHESYGLVTAQALRLGTPVIGSNAGGTAELVRHGVTGRLVAAGNEDAWKTALEEILSSPAVLEEWRKNAALHAHEFSEDAIGAAHEDFIATLSQSPA